MSRRGSGHGAQSRAAVGSSGPQPDAARCANDIGMFAAVLAALFLAGCGSSPQRPAATDGAERSKPPVTTGAARGRGGYYLDDGPGDNPPANIDQIPDAVPRLEPLHRGTMRPYTVMGRSYSPMTELAPYRARGIATWYGRRYHGQRTSSGEVYDMYAMTAAHTTLPIPSYARVTNPRNGRSIVVRINDRGPFVADRLIDLSYTAAHRLDILAGGSTVVDVEAIVPGSTEETTVVATARRAPATRTQVAEGIDVAARASETRIASGAQESVYLQLGAFSVPENAERFLARMRGELESMAPALRIVATDGLHRVHAGPYASRRDAARAAQRIGEVLGAEPLITTR